MGCLVDVLGDINSKLLNEYLGYPTPGIRPSYPAPIKFQPAQSPPS